MLPDWLALLLVCGPPLLGFFWCCCECLDCGCDPEIGPPVSYQAELTTAMVLQCVAFTGADQIRGLCCDPATGGCTDELVGVHSLTRITDDAKLATIKAAIQTAIYASDYTILGTPCVYFVKVDVPCAHQHYNEGTGDPEGDPIDKEVGMWMIRGCKREEDGVDFEELPFAHFLLSEQDAIADDDPINGEVYLWTWSEAGFGGFGTLAEWIAFMEACDDWVDSEATAFSDTLHGSGFTYCFQSLSSTNGPLLTAVY